MVDLPRAMPMYEQIASANGGLEVPLKTFTVVRNFCQKQKFHRRGGESRADCSNGLTERKVKEKGRMEDEG